MVMRALFTILLAGMAQVSTLHAQSVRWNQPGPVAPNSTINLELVFTDCEPAGKVSFPDVGGARFMDVVRTESQVSFINFRSSRSLTLTYAVLIQQAGRIPIPSFEVQTDQGKKSVSPIVLDATAQAPAQQSPAPSPLPVPPGFFRSPARPEPAASPEIKSQLSLQPEQPYVGEISDICLTISLPRSAGIEAAPISRPLWSPAGAEAEPWQEMRQISPDRIEIRTRMMFPKAGRVELSAVKMTFRVFRFITTFFGPQRQPAGDQEVSSPPQPIDVRPLPGGAPAGFKGAVGQFTLESKMVPEQVNEGEPITWTLNLKGTGNWPMGVELPSRTIPAKIRTIQPKLRREFDGTQVFTGGLVEDLVLIPTEAGEYELPAVQFVYFDPKKKSYETIEAKPPKISVVKEGTLRPTGPAQVTITPSGTPGPKQGSGPGWGGFGSGGKTKVLQYGMASLPREPLEGTGFGMAPMKVGWFRLLVVAPWLALVVIWLRWARKRASWTDPERGRKEALESWKSSAQHLGQGSASSETMEKNLLIWQKAVAGTLGVDSATPAWPEISLATSSLREGDRTELEKCWTESDEALYGRNPSLDNDWCERAASLASRIDLPQLKFWEPLRPRNLFPWLVSCLILVLAHPLVAEEKTTNAPTSSAEDPIRLYREGSFEKARLAWGEEVRRNTSDPISRNNLALTWFQSGDKERALAHGLSAYLVSPQTATVGWNLGIFAEAANQLDLAVRRLLEDSWTARLSAWAGVLAWQLWLVAGSCVAALGFGLWLASGYFEGYRKLFFRLGCGVVLFGAVLTFLAGSALGVYGKLSDRAAVMIVDVVPLRSVPTEVQQAEKTYPPGSIAHREKEFLGWSKVRMPNDDGGWIRTENLVPLY
ncbi:MAG: hypothetical protein EB090_05110 [Verrucomicrobia bacterium]|nr:hypothetical protein [Verrucomicrobiota bacterium]